MHDCRGQVLCLGLNAVACHPQSKFDTAHDLKSIVDCMVCVLSLGLSIDAIFKLVQT